MLDKQITAAKTTCRQRREVVISGNGNCFYPAVALGMDETSDEKHEEISRWSSCLFQKNPKVFEPPLFAIFNYKASDCSSAELTD